MMILVLTLQPKDELADDDEWSLSDFFSDLTTAA